MRINCILLSSLHILYRFDTFMAGGDTWSQVMVGSGFGG